MMRMLGILAAAAMLAALIGAIAWYVRYNRCHARDGSAAGDQVIERARGPILRQLGRVTRLP
jgi:hypothetical protein